jgi:hypothetical protein
MVVVDDYSHKSAQPPKAATATCLSPSAFIELASGVRIAGFSLCPFPVSGTPTGGRLERKYR